MTAYLKWAYCVLQQTLSDYTLHIPAKWNKCINSSDLEIYFISYLILTLRLEQLSSKLILITVIIKWNDGTIFSVSIIY